MSNETKCPICQNASCTVVSTKGEDSTGFDCEICGKFEIGRTVFSGPLDPEKNTLSPVQRAALSHRLRTASSAGTVPLITTDWYQHFISDPSLPSPAVQAANIIRYVGDEVMRTGKDIRSLPPAFHVIVGSPNRDFAVNLANELIRGEILRGRDGNTLNSRDITSANLTLAGWERYEAEKRGKFAGKSGFIAMKFGDDTLDPLVKNVIKPAIKTGLAYDLVDMRDIAQAGIIDNIMRVQIRDAAFVIVDLSHDNYGAYWEAGYAEGLGKPVIYICEESKFKTAQTHFDTNHCTTVLWSMDDDGKRFGDELIATLRRSLNLFPGSREQT